jgi:hypothetical protein
MCYTFYGAEFESGRVKSNAPRVEYTSNRIEYTSNRIEWDHYSNSKNRIESSRISNFEYSLRKSTWCDDKILKIDDHKTNIPCCWLDSFHRAFRRKDCLAYDSADSTSGPVVLIDETCVRRSIQNCSPLLIFHHSKLSMSFFLLIADSLLLLPSGRAYRQCADCFSFISNALKYASGDLSTDESNQSVSACEISIEWGIFFLDIIETAILKSKE